MSKEFFETLPEVEFKEVSLVRCGVCGYSRGTVIEKYNGTVPVLCRCDWDEIKTKKERFPSPSMYCPDARILWWTPTTDHISGNGRWSHTPHFGSPPMRIKRT